MECKTNYRQGKYMLSSALNTLFTRLFLQCYGAALILALLLASTAQPIFAQSLYPGFPGRNSNIIGPPPAGSNALPDNSLRQQNEPSCAVNPENPSQICCGFNDYRGIDIPGLGDAWEGVSCTRNGGTNWSSQLIPGHKLDAQYSLGLEFAADPNLVAVPGGLIFNYIAADRNQIGGLYVQRYAWRNREDGWPLIQVGGPILVAKGTGGRFIDKPHMAGFLDDNSSDTVTWNWGDGQSRQLPPGTLLVSAAVFVGNENNDGTKILVWESTDWGTSWKQSTKLTESKGINSGISLAASGDNVCAVWRRFDDNNESNSILSACSNDRGKRFGKAKLVAEICPFDLTTLNGQAPAPENLVGLRSNAFPVVAGDGSDFHVFWSDRGYALGNGPETGAGCELVGSDASGNPVFNPSMARIVHSRSTNGGKNWSTPVTVEDSIDLEGHQFMPSTFGANGEVVLAWIDTRDDVSRKFGLDLAIDKQLIVDIWAKVDPQGNPDPAAAAQGIYRHSADIRSTRVSGSSGGQANIAESVKVSSYQRGLVYDPLVGFKFEQLSWNLINARLFQQGTAPFIGDYTSVTAPLAVKNTEGNWQNSNTTPVLGAPTFWITWGDNRDIQGNAWGQGDDNGFTGPSPFTPGNPATTEGAATEVQQTANTNPSVQDPTDPAQAYCDVASFKADRTRDQNVYSAPLYPLVSLLSPGAIKSTGSGLSGNLLARSMPVIVQNHSDSGRYFSLTLANGTSDLNGRVSFTQNTPDPVSLIWVYVHANSSAVRTVFVESNSQLEPIRVVAGDCGQSRGSSCPGVSEIVLNEDPLEFGQNLEQPVVGSASIFAQETHSPTLLNPALITPELLAVLIDIRETHPALWDGLYSVFFNDNLFNGSIVNASLETLILSNPSLLNPELVDQDLLNTLLANPTLLNPTLLNADIDNPTLLNPTLLNPNLLNTALWELIISNPTLLNPTLLNPTLLNNLVENPTLVNGPLLNLIIEEPDLLNNSVLNALVENPTLLNPTLLNLVIGNPTLLNTVISNPTLLNTALWDVLTENPTLLNPTLLNQIIENPTLLNTNYPDIDPDLLNPTMLNILVANPTMLNPTLLNSLVANPTLLNPTMLNPTMLNPTMLNPNLLNPTLLNPTLLNPTLLNPDLLNPDLLNQVLLNPTLLNALVENPTLLNPTLLNPTLLNPTLLNSVLANPTLLKPTLLNPTLLNPTLLNPTLLNETLTDSEYPSPFTLLENPDLANPTLDPVEDAYHIDVTWQVKNDGNTTTGYMAQTFIAGEPEHSSSQLIVSQPALRQTTRNCEPVLESNNTILVNIPDPVNRSPILDPSPDDPDTEELASFVLAPGTIANVTMRVFADSPEKLISGNVGLYVSSEACTGNSSCSTKPFAITQRVKDIDPPVFVAPFPNVPPVTEATGPDGAIITFEGPTATDEGDGGSVPVACDYDSGDYFPVNTDGVATTNECTATDDSGNSNTTTFDVLVLDSTPPNPPQIVLPDGFTGELTAESPEGASVDFSQWVASATDVDGVDPSPDVLCRRSDDLESDYLPLQELAQDFALDDAEVTISCIAVDDSGNESTPVTVSYADGSPVGIAVSDTVAPILTLPADQIVEATSADGALVSYQASATDFGLPIAVSCEPASDTQFPVDETLVSCSATDGPNTTSASFTVTVRDTVFPLLAVSGDVTEEATSPAGAVVNYTAPTATDFGSPITASCLPASGSQFSQGTHTVACEASDAAGNTATAAFEVTVSDTTAPVLTAPDAGQLTREASSPAGSTVSFDVGIFDAGSSDPSLSCSVDSGGQFSLGIHEVSCTASDGTNTSEALVFYVTVQDTVAPVLTVPGNITTEAQTLAGSIVSFNASATDFGLPIDASCVPASGSLFTSGASTTVDCSASDGSNTSSASFTVTVTDTTPPVLTLQSDMVVEASEAGGAYVAYTAPVATDYGDPISGASCVPTSGSLFSIASNTVSCEVSDAAGNASNGTFTIAVQDTTAPSVTAPPATALTFEATGSAGATVNYTVSFSDLVDPEPTLVCDPASGSVFDLGTYPVDCTVEDDYQNVASLAFEFVIEDTKAPDLVVPGNITVEAASNAGTVVDFNTSATDIYDGPLTPQCDAISGKVFPIGPTLVSCSAADSSGNSSSGTFAINVLDTVGPVVTVPPETVVAEATEPGGALVSFEASATDFGLPIAVSCTPASASLFAQGDTAVSCSATDPAANTSSAGFNVSVVDTTPPELQLPDDITVEPDASGSTTVLYEVSASDIATLEANIDISCTPASGDAFDDGATEVSCTATDPSGNESSASFTVTVAIPIVWIAPLDDPYFDNVGANIILKWGYGPDENNLVDSRDLLDTSGSRTAPISITYQGIDSCESEEPEVVDIDAGRSALRYKSGSWQLNWQTGQSVLDGGPLPPGCYIMTIPRAYDLSPQDSREIWLN
jgi:HYR domain